MRRCDGNSLGGGKLGRDGGECAAPLGLDPQQLGFCFDILTGGASGKLRAAPVDMEPVDQPAMSCRGVDSGPDLRVPDLAQPDPARSVECTVGKEGVITCRTCWAP